MPTEPHYCPIADKFCTCVVRCEWYDRIADYSDAMMHRDRLDAERSAQDWSTRGEMLKPGT